MFPIGNWISSLKPIPPPKPPPAFDRFWEALGKFVKKAAINISIASMLIVVYLFGFSQANLLNFFQNIPLFSKTGSTGATATVTSIPGQKLYAVVVTSAPTELQAKTIINQLRASNIVASSFFTSGSYVVYIGELRTIAQAENALVKVRNKGFPGARIIP